jgi:CMP-N-acetylneuraminic acid synthetase/CTP:molybdopterin cytidylyltransferase MocA
LDQAIQSVLKQTFDDWELLVINDGSTDNTREVLSRYAEDSKVIAIEQENTGLLASCNIALRASRGEYIMRLDGDDYLDENALLVMSRALDTNQAVGLVYPDYYKVDEEGNITEVVRRKRVGEEVNLLDLPAHGACTMIRKSCLEELGGYNRLLACQDGYDLWIRFIRRFDVTNVNLPLFYYRQHGKNLTNNEERILDTRQFIKRQFVEKNLKARVPKVLAVIPVREHSNVIPNLGLHRVAGRPLIYYTIAESLGTPLLDQVVVTSDDPGILAYCQQFPRVITLERPEALAKPNVRIEPTVCHVLDELEKTRGYVPEAVMLLYVDAPLRRKEHIDKSIDTLTIFEADSVISVYEDNRLHYQHERDGLTPLFKRRLLKLERESLYCENGAIYLSRRDKISPDKFFGPKVGHIIMPKSASLKIDSEFDLWMISKILSERYEDRQPGH